MKTAIIIGHSEASPGARAYNGITEFEYNSVIAQAVNNRLKTPLPVYSRTSVSYPACIREMAKKMQEDGIRRSIELHFNAITGKTIVRGSRCLLFDKYWSNTIATAFQNLLFERMQIKKGRLNFVERNERGYMNIKLLENHGIENIILEPTFCHVESGESRMLINKPDIYSALLKDMLEVWL